MVMENQAYEQRLKGLTCLYEESLNFVEPNIQGCGRSKKDLIQLKENAGAKQTNSYKLIMNIFLDRIKKNISNNEGNFQISLYVGLQRQVINYYLGYIKRSIAGRLREVILSLYSALTWSTASSSGDRSTGKTQTLWSRTRGGPQK